jgi:hypothetical protein
MMANLGSVPAGSTLVFRYGPTAFEQATWVLSLALLVGLVAWLVRPAAFGEARRIFAGFTRLVFQGAFGGLARRASRWGEDP